MKLNDLKMSWKPQLLTGSAPITDQDILNLHNVGCSTVWNVYGSTEYPPPILIAKDDTSFDLQGMKFTDQNELLINGEKTGDIFDLNTGKFLKRTTDEIGKTWKNV